MGILKELGFWGTNEQQQQQNLEEGANFPFLIRADEGIY